ncbi:MAG TPA: hypothetical protein VNO51_15745 [Ilumatobacteraceae bacterium]|nr:hypothetical protein [Ilumatobacteraceae bacterium]
MSSPVADPALDGVGRRRRGFRHSLVANTRGVLLGAAAGAWAGLLTGGVGGRVAMGLLRITSPDYVDGRISDDGFEIGQVSGDTLFLLAITTALGAIAGVSYVAVRHAFPPPWRRAAWTLVGTTVGGSAILHADGVDFNLLEPTWLAVAMFVAIPAGGAALMAAWVERWDGWWFTQRRRTIVAALPALILVPLILPFVVAAAAIVLVSTASQSGRIRTAVRMTGPLIGRAAWAIVAALSSWALFNDVTEIL